MKNLIDCSVVKGRVGQSLTDEAKNRMDEFIANCPIVFSRAPLYLKEEGTDERREIVISPRNEGLSLSHIARLDKAHPEYITEVSAGVTNKHGPCTLYSILDKNYAELRICSLPTPFE